MEINALDFRNNKRLQSIDLLKAFTIFLVIMGHVANQWGKESVYSILSDKLIYSFHMPLFLTLSGLFLYKTLERGWLHLLTVRSRQLLLPVLSFSCIVFLLYYTTPIDLTDGLSFTGYLFAGGDMWFLKYLFVILTICLLFKTLCRNTLAAAIVSSVLLVCVSRVGIVRLLPYVWFGHFIYQNRDWIAKHTKVICAVSFAIYLSLMPFWHLEYDFPRYKVFSTSGGFAFNGSDALIILYRFAVGMSGSLFFIALALWQERKPWLVEFCNTKLGRAMSKCGTMTLTIYCLQIYLLEDVAPHLPLPEMSDWSNVGAVIVLSFLEFALCGVVAWALSLNKVSAWLFHGQPAPFALRLPKRNS